MTLTDIMTQLQSRGNEKMRGQNIREGAGENQFGVKLADLRAIAKSIKTNPALAAQLWNTGNLDAMLLATLLMDPKKLSADEVDRLVRSATLTKLTDWLMTNVIKLHPAKEALRVRWMADEHPMAARAGWGLTAERIVKNPEGIDLPALLDRIEREMATAHEWPQWTMNFCLGEAGIHFPEHRERAIAIGETLGVYRNYPTPKGCTSPFAPIWIAEIVRRQG